MLCLIHVCSPPQPQSLSMCSVLQHMFQYTCAQLAPASKPSHLPLPSWAFATSPPFPLPTLGSSCPGSLALYPLKGLAPHLCLVPTNWHLGSATQWTASPRCLTGPLSIPAGIDNALMRNERSGSCQSLSTKMETSPARACSHVPLPCLPGPLGFGFKNTVTVTLGTVVFTSPEG